ncbi:hypothetical protein B0T18DRAFT_26139 [Schizothecium vesticola]|uniref:Uncharacterized protein n=1 Tax=Schizothecium vesticola TaxID=314040 RepID=A0AA40FA03_9PEZI|nr:hypothetical protein B0T18DRAFT_26139 [Schizothecium vesticola]
MDNTFQAHIHSFPGSRMSGTGIEPTAVGGGRMRPSPHTHTHATLFPLPPSMHNIIISPPPPSTTTHRHALSFILPCTSSSLSLTKYRSCLDLAYIFIHTCIPLALAFAHRNQHTHVLCSPHLLSYTTISCEVPYPPPLTLRLFLSDISRTPPPAGQKNQHHPPTRTPAFPCCIT